MKAHRIRLTDEELAMIVAALSARMAMSKGIRLIKMTRLRERLAESSPGNPGWRLGWPEQAKETAGALLEVGVQLGAGPEQ